MNFKRKGLIPLKVLGLRWLDFFVSHNFAFAETEQNKTVLEHFYKTY